MTYAELKTAIANYLNRSDLTSDIDTFIDNVEAELNRRLRTKDMIKRATAAEDTDKEDITVTQAEVIGEAPAMQEVFRAIGKLSNSNSTVLLIGESGTGKELVARALFQHSPRKDKPFIALNMGDIPKELLEAELFGHEKGAFTGADERRIGRFESAHGGTLFLDEIGEIDSSTQVKLLRFLESKTIERLGSSKTIEIDTRLVCATNKDLVSMIKKGLFRDDLFLFGPGWFRCWFLETVWVGSGLLVSDHAGGWCSRYPQPATRNFMAPE